jgi:hypothetical protein
MSDINIKQVICRYNHTFILKNNGDLFGFGYNHHGQLGLGDINNRLIPTLLMKNTNITIINNHKINHEFTSNNYIFLPDKLKISIFIFLLVSKKYYINHNIKIPKFIHFEIFKFMCY